MSWYLQSVGGYAHRGTVDRGRVNALCGEAFEPVRAGVRGAARERGELEVGRLCAECLRHG